MKMFTNAIVIDAHDDHGNAKRLLQNAEAHQQ